MTRLGRNKHKQRPYSTLHDKERSVHWENVEMPCGTGSDGMVLFT